MCYILCRHNPNLLKISDRSPAHQHLRGRTLLNDVSLYYFGKYMLDDISFVSISLTGQLYAREQGNDMI